MSFISFIFITYLWWFLAYECYLHYNPADRLAHLSTNITYDFGRLTHLSSMTWVMPPINTMWTDFHVLERATSDQNQRIIRIPDPPSSSHSLHMNHEWSGLKGGWYKSMLEKCFIQLQWQLSVEQKSWKSKFNRLVVCGRGSQACHKHATLHHSTSVEWWKETVFQCSFNFVTKKWQLFVGLVWLITNI